VSSRTVGAPANEEIEGRFSRLDPFGTPMVGRWGQLTRRALAAAILAASAPGLAFPQQANPPPEPKPAQVDRNGVLILIRSTLLAIDQANKTGNYTVLRDLGAPGFQAANTAARLGDIFANLRRDKIDLSGVAVLEPQLTLLPQIEANVMHMTGFFPSVPEEVKFELLYAPVEGRWRLYGVSVGLAQSGPVAPGPAPLATTAPALPRAQAAPPALASPAKKPTPAKKRARPEQAAAPEQ
jgi:hypothetical protein